MEYAVFDIESTGLSKKENEVIELSIFIVNDNGEEIEQRFHSYFKPLVPMEEDNKAMAIHGITNDFLEDAYALRGARFLLCNQSWMWNCATALGTPRLLEVCNFAQNCLPFYGDDNRGYYHQVSLEHYFRMMYNNTMHK